MSTATSPMPQPAGRADWCPARVRGEILIRQAAIFWPWLLEILPDDREVNLRVLVDDRWIRVELVIESAERGAARPETATSGVANREQRPFTNCRAPNAFTAAQPCDQGDEPTRICA